MNQKRELYENIKGKKYVKAFSNFFNDYMEFNKTEKGWLEKGGKEYYSTISLVNILVSSFCIISESN